MECKNCGSEIKEGAAFCSNCGTRNEADPAPDESVPVEQAPPTPQQPPPPPPPPPPIPQQPPVQPPQGAYTPPRQPPPYNAQVPQAYIPPQGYVYQPVPAYPPPGGLGKSKTGLAIAIVVAVILLFIAAGVIGMMMYFDTSGGSYITSEVKNLPFLIVEHENPPVEIQPAPPQPPPPQPAPQPEPEPTPPPPPPPTQSQMNAYEELIGIWLYESGDDVYFFVRSEMIMFIDNGDGTYGVLESAYEEEGLWHIDENGMLIIDGDQTGIHEFEYSITGNILTLTDIDGDTIRYTRAVS